MKFTFTKSDDIHNLHPDIKLYMENFVNNRIIGFSELQKAVTSNNHEGVRNFCHKQLGVAVSYNCHRLDEICRYIQDYARKEEMAPISAVMDEFEAYLKDLKSEVDAKF